MIKGTSHPSSATRQSRKRRNKQDLSPWTPGGNYSSCSNFNWRFSVDATEEKWGIDCVSVFAAVFKGFLRTTGPGLKNFQRASKFPWICDAKEWIRTFESWLILHQLQGPITYLPKKEKTISTPVLWAPLSRHILLIRLQPGSLSPPTSRTLYSPWPCLLRETTKVPTHEVSLACRPPLS